VTTRLSQGPALTFQASRGNAKRRFTMRSTNAIIIGALLIALAVVGYLYYQRTKSDITIQLPNVELKR
jgi:predicted negative regulator of RcsB-dependent stress response